MVNTEPCDGTSTHGVETIDIRKQHSSGVGFNRLDRRSAWLDTLLGDTKLDFRLIFSLPRHDTVSLFRLFFSKLLLLSLATLEARESRGYSRGVIGRDV